MYQAVNRFRRATLRDAYKAGQDYATHGANNWNCDISNFATPESTEAWEAGKAGVEYDFTRDGK